MIDCLEADVLAAAMSVGSLESAEQLTLNSHLTGCARCRRVVSEYMAAAGLLAVAPEPMRPSPELRTRLMRAVYSEAAKVEKPRRVPLLERVMARIPTGRGFAVLAGAAAGVLIGVASMSGLSHTTGSPASPTVAVTLTGQPIAPGAHGRLDYNPGTKEANVTVTGLAAPSKVSAGGAVYEVWLIPTAGNPVPAGYLTLNPSGAWTAAIDMDVTRYQTVAATIEPAGGSPTPTGTEVIQGSITA